jgi:serine/threonine protein kinase
LEAANIYFSADGKIKIGQFYLAKVLSAKYAYGQLAPMSCMSPEAIDGKKATPATDIWSLGILLHLMCCLDVFLLF